ncbi:phage tail assembly chaperone G, partial [Staphylococcus aureus]|uniref:phage tail assembly chaperone G n=1 Tax=Staphylococcus aureus TaxID=1280 RepID=UPI0039B74599
TITNSQLKTYDNQFTVKDLKERMHAPDGMNALREQVIFITQGQQTEETRNFIQNMK